MQSEVEHLQEKVNGLHSMVVVVDENNAESGKITHSLTVVNPLRLTLFLNFYIGGKRICERRFLYCFKNYLWVRIYFLTFF